MYSTPGQAANPRGSTKSERVFSTFDGFIYGIYANSIVIAAFLTYSLLWPWPKANIPLGIVLVCLAFIPMFTVYAMLTTLMPRIGGDYVWQTRSIGLGWGFILIVPPLMIGPWFYMASNVAPASTMVIAPLMISLAKILNAPALTDLGIVISTKSGTWWFYVLYVSFAGVVMLLGMKFYARLQRISFIIGLLALASWALMLFFTSSSQFQEAFNSFMAGTLQWGHHDAYRQILQRAVELGYKAKPLSETTVRSSFLIGPALAYTFMYIACTSLMAGEIRGVDKLKNSVTIFLGGNLFSMVVCAGFMWLLLSRLSNEFFTSANFLWATGQGQNIPVPPNTGLFLMALGGSPWYWLWVAVGLNAWFWIWPTNNIVTSTRIMLAMSQDRLLPSFVTRLSKNRGTPVVAICICYACSLLMGWLYFFTGFSRLTLDMPFMTSIAFAASTLAGTLIPYLPKTRRLYQNSELSAYTILGLPLITVSGVLGLIYFAIMFVLYLTDQRYGTNDPLSAWFILGSLAFCMIVLLLILRSRRKRGTDLSYLLQIIPSD
jgi:APA family basic amino acid/polyamine antiporter